MAGEEYSLEISDRVILRASTYQGVTLGLSSLVQLLELEKDGLRLPCLEITDHPDLAYRAVLLVHYFYKSIQNQLSILFKTPEMEDFAPFEELVLPLKSSTFFQAEPAGSPSSSD